MATIVAGFPGTPATGTRAKARYDWPGMADGQVHKLDKGVDFDAKPSSAAQRAKSWAAKNGKILSWEISGDSLFVRFYADPNAAPVETVAAPVAPVVGGNPFVQ